MNYTLMKDTPMNDTIVIKKNKTNVVYEVHKFDDYWGWAKIATFLDEEAATKYSREESAKNSSTTCVLERDKDDEY